MYTTSAASMLVVEPGLSSSTSDLVLQLLWMRTSVDEWPMCCRPSPSVLFSSFSAGLLRDVLMILLSWLLDASQHT